MNGLRRFATTVGPDTVLLVGIVLLVGGLIAGRTGALLGLLVLAVVRLGDLASRFPRRVRPPLRPLAPTRPAPSFPTYDRTYASVLLASTSGRQYVLGVRPVLQRVLAAELADHGDQAVRARLGEKLWHLVDPAVPERDLEGVRPRDLAELLDRLEDR